MNNKNAPHILCNTHQPIHYRTYKQADYTYFICSIVCICSDSVLFSIPFISNTITAIPIPAHILQPSSALPISSALCWPSPAFGSWYKMWHILARAVTFACKQDGVPGIYTGGMRCFGYGEMESSETMSWKYVLLALDRQCICCYKWF